MEGESSTAANLALAACNFYDPTPSTTIVNLLTSTFDLLTLFLVRELHLTWETLVFSTTCDIGMSLLCFEHDVRPSVRLSATVVDCDQIVQRHIGVLATWMPMSTTTIVKLRILRSKTSGVRKNVEFYTSAAIISDTVQAAR